MTRYNIPGYDVYLWKRGQHEQGGKTGLYVEEGEE